MNIQKRGQIWVETVIYTLIGLSLIGLVLAILTPQIKSFRDKNLIEQTIESFSELDTKINEVLDAPGNKRKIEFGLTRGNLHFNSIKDRILWDLENSEIEYSESGITLKIGRINVTTTEFGDKHKVVLDMAYNHNITFDGSDGVEKIINPRITPPTI